MWPPGACLATPWPWKPAWRSSPRMRKKAVSHLPPSPQHLAAPTANDPHQQCCSTCAAASGKVILAEGAIALPVTLSGGALFACRKLLQFLSCLFVKVILVFYAGFGPTYSYIRATRSHAAVPHAARRAPVHAVRACGVGQTALYCVPHSRHMGYILLPPWCGTAVSLAM